MSSEQPRSSHYDAVAELGVSAEVWNEVYAEVFGSLAAWGEGYNSHILPAFSWMQFDLSRPERPVPNDPEDGGLYRRFDYSRGPDETDREYVKRLLLRSNDHYVAECKEAEIEAAKSGRRVVDDGTESEIDWEAYDKFKEEELAASSLS